MQNGILKRLLMLSTAGMLCSTIANAQMVTLESFDGSINITGILLDYDGDKYVVRSPIGTINVKSFEMRCSGDGCPKLSEERDQLRILDAAGLPTDAVATLVVGYARSIDADARREGTAQDESAIETISIVDSEDLGVTKVDVKPWLFSNVATELASSNDLLAITSRPVSEREARRVLAPGFDSLRESGQEVVLALDGIIVATHPANPVRAVSQADLSRIFSGEIQRWSELGGYDAAIKLYLQDQESGTMSVFDTNIMEPDRVRFSSTAEIMESDGAVSTAVAKDPFGIGVSSFSALGEAKALSIVGSCGVQTPANEFTIKTEEYPLTRRVFMYLPRDEVSGYAARIADFARSDEGQFILSESGLVDQRISARPIDEQGIRLASAVMENGTEVQLRDLREMMGDIVSGDRLSLTYRFDFGSANLDSRALGDIERLSDLLSTGSYENTEVLLVGFSDGIGDPIKNRALSLARAEVVREALESAAPRGSLDNVRIRAVGYGEASPLGCNNTDLGRSTNRRVEVWISDLVVDTN